MAKLKASRQINGTFGSVWVNNNKWLDIEEFEAKAALDYEDVNMPEDLATHKKLTSWSGEGTMTTKKVYSRGAALLATALKRGEVPEVSLVGKLADPDAYGAERVAINEVTFTEFTLLAFQQKTIMTEELPFNFADYEFIDLIE